MARIGKFFKKSGPKNVVDEAPVMAKGDIKGMGLTEQAFPVADTPADDPVDGATTVTSPAVKAEERDEVEPLLDLGSSASSETMTMQSVSLEDEVLNTNMHSHIDRDVDDGITEDDVRSFVTTPMENDVTAKYFHKDVVVNCMEDSALIIRAMYCIPKPSREDHVVVKVEVSIETEQFKFILSVSNHSFSCRCVFLLRAGGHHHAARCHELPWFRSSQGDASLRTRLRLGRYHTIPRRKI